MDIPETELIYVHSPEIWLADQEARRPSLDVMWQMKKVLYGRRKACQMWYELLKDTFESCDMERSDAVQAVMMMSMALVQGIGSRS